MLIYFDKEVIFLLYGRRREVNKKKFLKKDSPSKEELSSII